MPWIHILSKLAIVAITNLDIKSKLGNDDRLSPLPYFESKGFEGFESVKQPYTRKTRESYLSPSHTFGLTIRNIWNTRFR